MALAMKDLFNIATDNGFYIMIRIELNMSIEVTYSKNNEATSDKQNNNKDGNNGIGFKGRRSL
jgi:hypothetical protein